MKLITEHTEAVCSSIQESQGEKKFIIEGVFMESEVKNGNGRVYPKKVLKEAVDKYVTEQVRTGRAVGELNHPTSPSINLDKVSHRITELTWHGSKVMGKALVLDTPMGKIVKGLLEGDCQLGVSSRGVGSISERQGSKYVDRFILSTVDIVQNPSAPTAFVNGIMEGVEYFFNGSDFVAEAAEDAQKQLKRMSLKEISEKQESVFRNFLRSI